MKDKVKFSLSQKLMVFWVPRPLTSWMLMYFLKVFFSHMLMYMTKLSGFARKNTIPSCKPVLIKCGIMFRWVFFLLQWTICLAYHQKHYQIPLFPKKFTFFYTYIILHDRIKSCTCIYFTFTLFYIAM